MFSRFGARIRARRVAQDKEDLARWEEEGGAPNIPSAAVQEPAGLACGPSRICRAHCLLTLRPSISADWKKGHMGMHDNDGLRSPTKSVFAHEGSPRLAKRVLIIDDNVDSAEALCMLLELEGHEVKTAHDGQSGLVLIEKTRPHVVLCDIGLPGMTGYQVAQAVRAHEHVPVMAAITGYGQASDARRAQSAGFDHHFVKPVDLARVLDLIASA